MFMFELATTRYIVIVKFLNFTCGRNQSVEGSRRPRSNRERSFWSVGRRTIEQRTPDSGFEVLFNVACIQEGEKQY